MSQFSLHLSYCLVLEEKGHVLMYNLIIITYINYNYIIIDVWMDGLMDWNEFGIM